jgi:signal transduction histidine kinase
VNQLELDAVTGLSALAANRTIAVLLTTDGDVIHIAGDTRGLLGWDRAVASSAARNGHLIDGGTLTTLLTQLEAEAGNKPVHGTLTFRRWTGSLTTFPVHAVRVRGGDRDIICVTVVNDLHHSPFGDLFAVLGGHFAALINTHTGVIEWCSANLPAELGMRRNDLVYAQADTIFRGISAHQPGSTDGPEPVHVVVRGAHGDCDLHGVVTYAVVNSVRYAAVSFPDQQRSRQSQLHAALLEDNAGAHILTTDSTGTITFASGAFTSHHAPDGRRILGRQLSNWLPVHPDDTARFGQLVSSGGADDIRLLTKQQGLRTIRVISRPLPLGGAVFSFEDRSDIRAAEVAVTELTQDAAVIRTDSAGAVRWISDGAAPLVNLTPDRGTITLTNLFPSWTAADVNMLLDAAQRSTTRRTVTHVTTRTDGVDSTHQAVIRATGNDERIVTLIPTHPTRTHLPARSDLGTTLGNLGVGVVAADRNNVVTDVNSVAAALLNSSARQLVGSLLEDLVDSLAFGACTITRTEFRTLLDDLEPGHDMIIDNATVVAGGRTSTAAVRLTRSDDEGAAPSLLVTLVDTTRLTTMQRDAADATRRHVRLVERLSEGVVVSTAQRAILINDAARTILDLSRSGSIADLSHLIDPDTGAVADPQPLTVALNGGTIDDRLYILPGNVQRPPRHLRLSATPSAWTDDTPVVVVNFRDHTREHGMLAELETANQELDAAHERALTALAALDDVRHRERAALARAAHDGPVQDLIRIRWQLDTGDSDPLGQVIDDLRLMIMDLRPRELDERGLRAALDELAAAARIPTAVSGNVSVGARLPPHVEDVLWRCIREAFRNAERHAHAHSIDIIVNRAGTRTNPMIIAAVSDDGNGFDVSQVSDGRDGHIGLLTMHETVRSVGGTTTILSDADNGTTVRFQLPFDPTDLDITGQVTR